MGDGSSGNRLAIRALKMLGKQLCPSPDNCEDGMLIPALSVAFPRGVVSCGELKVMTPGRTEHHVAQVLLQEVSLQREQVNTALWPLFWTGLGWNGPKISTGSWAGFEKLPDKMGNRKNPENWQSGKSFWPKRREKLQGKQQYKSTPGKPPALLQSQQHSPVLFRYAAIWRAQSKNWVTFPGGSCWFLHTTVGTAKIESDSWMRYSWTSAQGRRWRGELATLPGRTGGWRKHQVLSILAELGDLGSRTGALRATRFSNLCDLHRPWVRARDGYRASHAGFTPTDAGIEKASQSTQVVWFHHYVDWFGMTNTFHHHAFFNFIFLRPAFAGSHWIPGIRTRLDIHKIFGSLGMDSKYTQNWKCLWTQTYFGNSGPRGRSLAFFLYHYHQLDTNCSILLNIWLKCLCIHE